MNAGAEVHVIETKGGYHVMIRTKTVRYNFHDPVTKLDLEAKAMFEKAEVVINVNAMVPLPGTVQADFEVTISEGLDFIGRQS
jgi:hypothetical protein